MNPQRRSLLRRFAPALAAALTLMLTSCPNPISPQLANVVEDRLPPVVTVDQPENNTSFRSSLTVSGTIVDSSLEEGDGKGVLETITFEVSGADYLERSLLIAGDQYTYQPAGVDFFDPATGAFEIAFSTVDPTPLTGFRVLTLTVTDRKGNETVERITVFAYTDGPYIELYEPVDGDRYETAVTIRGRVTNGFGETASDEVDADGLSYLIDSQGGAIPAGYTPAGVDRAESTYDPATGEFEVNHILNPKPSGSISLVVTAKDRAGYTSAASVTLSDPPLSALDFESPGENTLGDYYYSSAVTTSANATVTVTGTPREPAEIQSIIWDTTGGLVTPETNIGYSYPPAACTFDVDLSGAATDAGDVNIRIRAYDQNDRLASYTFRIQDEPNAPVLAAGNPSDIGAGNAYLDLHFDKGVWGVATGPSGQNIPSGPVDQTYFSVSTSEPLTAVTLGTPATITGGPLVGGETDIRIPLLISGQEPDTGDTITVNPGGSPPARLPRDRANNEWTQSPDVGLQDQRRPRIASIAVGTVTGARIGPSTSNIYINRPPVGAPDTVELIVTFSEDVTITGSPSLQLDLNGDRVGDGVYAAYSDDGSLKTDHTFLYTVAAGHNTATGAKLDYAASGLGGPTLLLSGAVVEDVGGLVLDDPYLLTGSLPGDDIIVDTSAPGAPPVTPIGVAAAATGNNEVGGYVNNTNTNLEVQVANIHTADDPTLVEGLVELLMDGSSFASEVSGTITGGSAVVTLLAIPDSAELQTMVPDAGPGPVDRDFTVRLYDAAGNAGPESPAYSRLTADYTVPTKATNVNAVALDGSPPAGYANSSTTTIRVTASIVPSAGSDQWVAELLLDGDPLVPTVTQTDLSSGSILLDWDAGTTANLQALMPQDSPTATDPGTTHTFTVAVSIPSGNESVSDDSDTIVADYTPPDAPSSLSVTIAGGTVVSGYINSTNTNLTGSSSFGSNQANGGQVHLYYDGSGTPLQSRPVTSGSQTSVSFDLGFTTPAQMQAALSESTFDGSGQPIARVFTSRAQDYAGNISSPRTGPSRTIDYTAPSDPSTITGMGDNGNEVPGYTNTTNTDLDVTVSGIPVAYGGSALGGTAELYLDHAQLPTRKFSGTITSSGQVVIDLDTTNNTQLRAAVPTGSHTLTVVLTDAAGNVAGESTTFGTVVADYVLPYVVAAHSLDTNFDGDSDSLELEFDDAILDSSVVSSRWRMRHVGGTYDTFPAGGAFSTAVTSFGSVNVANDKYFRLTLTPSNIVGTGSMQYDTSAVDGVRDLAGNEFGDISATAATDMARAVLVGALNDETGQSTAGIFNEDGDELRLTFSENLRASDVASWTAADMEVFFTFSGVDDSDGGNFHSGVAAALDTDNRILLLTQTGAGASTNVVDATANDTLVSVTAYFNGAQLFYGADDNPVHTSAGITRTFSVSGGGSGGYVSGPGVAITGTGRAGTASSPRLQTTLLPPLEWPSDQAPVHDGPASEVAGAAPGSADSPIAVNLTADGARRAGAPTQPVPTRPVQPRRQPGSETATAVLPNQSPVRPLDTAATMAGHEVSTSRILENSATIETPRGSAESGAHVATSTGGAVAVGAAPAPVDPTPAAVASREAGGTGWQALILFAAALFMLAGGALLALSLMGRRSHTRWDSGAGGRGNRH